MSLADRRITAVMRQIASQDVVEIVHPYARLQTLGALAYIAECYGFRYVEVRRAGENKSVHVYLVRDAAPGHSSARRPTRPRSRRRAREARSPACGRVR